MFSEKKMEAVFISICHVLQAGMLPAPGVGSKGLKAEEKML